MEVICFQQTQWFMKIIWGSLLGSLWSPWFSWSRWSTVGSWHLRQHLHHPLEPFSLASWYTMGHALLACVGVAGHFPGSPPCTLVLASVLSVAVYSMGPLLTFLIAPWHRTHVMPLWTSFLQHVADASTCGDAAMPTQTKMEYVGIKERNIIPSCSMARVVVCSVSKHHANNTLTQPHPCGEQISTILHYIYDDQHLFDQSSASLPSLRPNPKPAPTQTLGLREGRVGTSPETWIHNLVPRLFDLPAPTPEERPWFTGHV